jgi:hypothetical protein
MPRYLYYSKELKVGWVLLFTYSKTRELFFLFFFIRFLWLHERLPPSTASFQPSFNIKQKSMWLAMKAGWFTWERTSLVKKKKISCPNNTSDKMVSECTHHHTVQALLIKRWVRKFSIQQFLSESLPTAINVINNQFE